MAMIKEIKMELRHREWAEQIQECQNSGQTVKEWCESSGIKRIRQPILQTNKNGAGQKNIRLQTTTGYYEQL